jgi:hypothetical protein
MGTELNRQTLGAAAKVDSPPRYLDNGSGGKLLRPENQVAKVADVAGGGTVDAQSRTAIDSLRDALVSAGVMKSA